jgi:hypothetical protein
MRHINPIRQSGPLPPYFGTYTMEDIKKQYDVCYLPADIDYIQVDVDEIMRRVPGVNIYLVRSLEKKQHIFLNLVFHLINKLLMLIKLITWALIFFIRQT